MSRYVVGDVGTRLVLRPFDLDQTPYLLLAGDLQDGLQNNKAASLGQIKQKYNYETDRPVRLNLGGG